MIERETLLNEIKKPYWFTSEELPGLDFNREIVEPGKNEKWPDGVLAIRADGDFWVVAAIPLKYRNVPFEHVIKALWPQYAEEAEVTPDSGSLEQEVYFAKEMAKREKLRADHYWAAIKDREREISRLRRDRPDAVELPTSRYKAECNYFIRQYQHLLIACAHEHEPRADKPGICGKCGLSASDRIHMRHYIELHDKGYEPSEKHLTEFGESDRFD